MALTTLLLVAGAHATVARSMAAIRVLQRDRVRKLRDLKMSHFFHMRQYHRRNKHEARNAFYFFLDSGIRGAFTRKSVSSETKATSEETVPTRQEMLAPTAVNDPLFHAFHAFNQLIL